MEPTTTLDKILQLIDNDVNKIQESFSGLQLDDKTAQTLVRYASALAGIKQDKQKDAVKEKQDINKLSTDELIELYKSTKKD
jgi:hypothetical protein